MRHLVVFTACAALVIPAGAMAVAGNPPSANQLAVQACKQQVAALGKEAFRSTYGANAYGKCVAQGVRAARAHLSNAAKECRAERSDVGFPSSHDGKSFAEFYGSTGNGRNAFGKCVSAKAKADAKADTKAVVGAAKQCKAERSANRAAFRDTYGLGPKKTAAFARCIKAKLATP